MTAETPGRGSVLTVCTGNLCRSPLAEGLLRAALDGAGVLVGSAGTHAQPGVPMDPYAAAELADRGIVLPDFGARRLTAELVASADLVLTATRVHRAAVVGLDPAAAGRTFTFGELARLLDGLDPDPGARPADLAARARAGRGRGRPARRREDDLADPVGRPRRHFARCAAELDELLTAPLRWLA